MRAALRPEAPERPVRRPAQSTARRAPGQSRVDRFLERADERPKPPWHPVPLIELSVLVGLVLIVVGAISFGVYYKFFRPAPTNLPPAPTDPTGVRRLYARGVLAMANAGPDTNGSQFFLVYGDSALRPNYSIFGRVTAPGLATLLVLEDDEPGGAGGAGGGF